MAIEKMKLVSFYGKTGKLDKIISKCLLSGNFDPEVATDHIGFSEIVDLLKGSEAIQHLDDLLEYSSDEGAFSSSAAVRYISSVLGYNISPGENPYLPMMQSIRDLAEEYGYQLEEDNSKVEGVDIDESFNEYVGAVAENLKKLGDERNDLMEQKKACSDGIAQFSHFVGLDIPLEEIMGANYITARFGHMPKAGRTKLELAYSDNPYVLFIPCTTEGDECWVLYIAPKEKIAEVDKIFAALRFSILKIPSAVGSVDDIIANLKQNEDILDKSIEEYNEKINAIMTDEKEKINSVYTQVCAKNAVFEIKKYSFIFRNGFYLVGWVPEKKVKSLVAKLRSFNGVNVTVQDPEEIEDREPPVKLKNPRIIRPFEYYVNMYGLPGYKDMDITFFVAVVYTFVFGVMFGDVGQGIVLAIAGLLMWKFKKMDLGKILVPCGISSAVCGFVFGSVFGYEDALDPLYRVIGLGHKPVEVMESVNGILVFAIFVGVFLMFCAMALHTAISFKRKEPGEAIFSQNGITGIIFYACAVNEVYAFMGGKEIIPGKICVPVLLVCILILFFKEILIALTEKKGSAKPESIGDFILQNLFECLLYVLEYFSNTLSFLRVGAFVIVHASMMSVVFTLAGDPKSPKGIVIVILGNVLVIALEGLLTGIQGLRLVFYEMFSRFHEGGGKPFSAIRLYKKTK